jgi:hypothetical protein
VRETIAFCAAAVLLFTAGATAQDQLPLREALKDIPLASHWIYDDLPRAQAEAKATGKPLLVVLRCVPCPPGRTLDTQVMSPDASLEELERQFVCVRVIQANSLNLKQFQYDYDMSWAAVIMNADGTIYGRYGTRNGNGPASDTYLSTAAFRRALGRALAIHKAYPANRQVLAGKTGATPEYAVPTQIPGLQDRPAAATVKQDCIHCHMVKEYALRAKWEETRLSAADLWVYPMPERIGLTLGVDDGLLVKAVAAGSPAEAAGLAAGDQLQTLNHQPLISMADVQWALHSAPNETRLPITFRRNGEPQAKTLTLSGDWKKSDIAWRASSWYGLRQGLRLTPLSAADKQARGIEPDKLAMAVTGLWGRGGPKLQAAGLQNGDVIIAVDGSSADLSESEFLVNLRLAHGPKDSVKFTVLRGENRQQLTIPMW